MAQIKESGHYAIAGFLYQILDAGARKLEICNVPRKDGELDKLYLERFGQDAVVLADNGDVKKLIQCKYSSKDAEIQPSELRRILERLVESARALNLDLAEIRYELRTNRELSDDATRGRGIKRSPIRNWNLSFAVRQRHR